MERVENSLKFSIAADVFEKLPELCIGVVYAKGINSPNSSLEIDTLLEKSLEQVVNKFQHHKVKDERAIQPYRQAFSVGELMARMRVSLRRSSASEHEPVITCGDLVVDLLQRRVTVADREIKLTPTEYELIKVLAQHRGRVLTHRQLLKAVWGTAYNEDTHYIRVYIGQLRRKIEANPTQPRHIITESGVGYRLMEH